MMISMSIQIRAKLNDSSSIWTLLWDEFDRENLYMLVIDFLYDELPLI